MNSSRRGIWTILFFIYIAAVLWCCFGNFNDVPKPPISLFGIPMDKLVHFILFFPFPLLGWLAFDRFTIKPWQTVLFVTVTFFAGCLLAAATEAGQSLTSYRTGDIKDFAADAVSLAISSVIVLFIDLYKQKK